MSTEQTLLLHVNVTVLLLMQLPSDATSAEMKVCALCVCVCVCVCALLCWNQACAADVSRLLVQAAASAARAQAAAGVSAVTAAPLAVFNATCLTLAVNVSLAALPATQLVSPPEAPPPSSAWCVGRCTALHAWHCSNIPLRIAGRG